MSDCNIGGYYLDALSLIVPSQQSLSIRVTASAFDPWVGLYTGDGNLLAMNDDTLLGVAHNAWVNVIVPAGSYLITPSPFGPGLTGDYTVTAYGRPVTLAGCDADTTNLLFMNPGLHYTGSDRSAVWLTRGVSFPETLTTGDCVDASGPFYSDRAFVWLDSGAVLTVREASGDFNAYLTLFGPNHFRAFNDDSANAATTRNSYLVVQAPVSGAYLLEFGTRDTAKTGNYTISIAGAGPTPAAGLGAPPGWAGARVPRK
jgi:serine protease Do